VRDRVEYRRPGELWPPDASALSSRWLKQTFYYRVEMTAPLLAPRLQAQDWREAPVSIYA